MDAWAHLTPCQLDGGMVSVTTMYLHMGLGDDHGSLSPVDRISHCVTNQDWPRLYR